MPNLLDLPAEIRQKIWKYAVHENEVICCVTVWDDMVGSMCSTRVKGGRHDVSSVNPNLGLSLANKQVREEVKPVLLTSIDFCFSTLWWARDALNSN